MKLTTKKERIQIVREVFTWALGQGADDVHDLSGEVIDEVLAELNAAADTDMSSDAWSAFDNYLAIPLEDEQIEEDEDDDDLEGVILVTAAYEWVCPSCGGYNRTAEAKAVVRCYHCEGRFETTLGDS